MDVKRRMRLLLLMGSLVIALLLAIAACGATPGSAGTGHVPAAQRGATPASTADSATASPSPSQAIHRPAPVVLVPGATHYAGSGTITINIRNTSSLTIYARTSFTDCTIITLAYRAGSSWRPVNLCADGYPHPGIMSIAPGQQIVVQLAAETASSDAGGGATTQWPAGTYRTELTYTTNMDESFDHGTTAYSPTFVIGG